ncbi:MAG: glycosyltransferase family 1 protein [Beijerinckiaceae bacterium]|jgi:glycosyltransferase involved in cell wall biosynthesis|nr:glycosyltransferase family 1 protein [Beijerinckiaceae bacterium]
MKILIATDAWEPQVNGVVRTLQATIDDLRQRGHVVKMVTPRDFQTFAMPTYPDIRLAMVTAGTLRAVLVAEQPDAIHIATEGPIGWAMRGACLALGRCFTTSYHTRFPEYVSARVPVPEWMTYAMLRHFHAPAARVMVSTHSMRADLKAHGFTHLAHWPRGVDTALFHPDQPRVLDLPRPIFLTVSRLAPEKNLQAFLGLDLPGSKVVVGDGPQADALKARFPHVHFAGLKQGRDLAALYASADAFVFPSLTDTYGIVLLEAAASGLPVAAFPVPGPLDVVGGSDVACLDFDLRRACLAALAVPRPRCRAFAMTRSWPAATDAFVANLAPATATAAASAA